MNEQSTRHELTKLESRMEWLTQELNRVTGQPDEVLRRLQDLDGAHDRRVVTER